MDIYFIERSVLLTIFKTFISPHLDYSYINYDQTSIILFTDTIESIQYNAAIITTGVIRDTSREKN